MNERYVLDQPHKKHLPPHFFILLQKEIRELDESLVDQ